MEIKPLVFYKTTADFNNTGEVLIYKNLLENIREYGDVIIDNSAHIQPLFLKRIGVRECEKLHNYSSLSFTKYILWSAIRNFFVRRPMFFVTGVGDHAVKNNKDVIKNICSFIFLLLIRICGVKTLRIGMSIKFNGKKEELSERLLGTVLSNYYVRDSISFNKCKKAGVNAKMAPDLSWGYKIEGHERSNESSKQVILSFRDYVHKQAPEPYKTELYNAIGMLLEHICKNPGIHVLLTFQCDYDKRVQEELYERFKYLGNISLADELITLDNAEEYYGKSSIVITNRLHVLLLAYKYGALTIGYTDLKAHAKIFGIFKDEGIENHLIDIHDSQESIVSKYDQLCECLDEEWGKIRQIETSNYIKLKEIFSSVFNND